MPISYTDTTMQPTKIELFTFGYDKPVTLSCHPCVSKTCRIAIGEVEALVPVQDLLNAARLLGAKDITTEISQP